MTNEFLLRSCYFVTTAPMIFAKFAADNFASESQLFIFSEGSKTIDDESNVAQVRNYISSVSGFNKVDLILALCTKGLATSIIAGVSTALNKFENHRAGRRSDNLS